eukprot:TRINITY_DN7401_c0_g1_i1.p1 TRINITY_DN7401_c0_g1~~TRINITY_DN7401_c0_g1_i1.p1  ORF type:complete len:230 (-),score=59.10 TRINITY_DN7401_c0_g1_i1:169-858(-)
MGDQSKDLMYLASMLEDFSSNLNRMKNLFSDKANLKDNSDLILELREKNTGISKQIFEKFKHTKFVGAASTRASKLKRDFESVLKTFEQLSRQIADKSKIEAQEIRDSFRKQNSKLSQEIEFMGTEVQNLEEELNTRENDFRQIEKDVLEINQMAKDMSEMTQSQGEKLHEVEMNVKSSRDNMKDANKELTEANNIQKSTTSSAAKYVGILVVILLIIILVYVFFYSRR